MPRTSVLTCIMTMISNFIVIFVICVFNFSFANVAVYLVKIWSSSLSFNEVKTMEPLPEVFLITFIKFFKLISYCANIELPHVVCLLTFMVNKFSKLFLHAYIFSSKDWVYFIQSSAADSHVTRNSIRKNVYC